MPQRAKRQDDDDDAHCIKMSIAHAVTTHSLTGEARDGEADPVHGNTAPLSSHHQA